MIETGLPDLTGLDGADVAVEAARLAAGEPWFSSEVAGLQYYAYGTVDELTGDQVIPQPGDRLHLVREPENPHYRHAIQVWWQNSHMLGHLPRSVAAEVAPLLDAKVAARAYVAEPGDGEAWSLRALVVGPAAEPWWSRYIEHVAWRALAAPAEEYERAAALADRAEKTRSSMEMRRRRRLRDAVETLLTVPCDVILPAPYDDGRIDVDTIARALRCSESTVVRIAAKCGIRIGRFDYAVAVTPDFEAALKAWARKPKRKPEKVPARDIQVRAFHRETDFGGQYACGR
ncbi:MAG: HIRAN domain-containing protein [Methylobacterium frigidaeris]